MATRTISNTGGNYNATGTWVEGVVPTSADDIAATATSGQLTVNVSSAARNVNLTNYSNTITINSAWTISGASFTNTFPSGVTFAGTHTNFNTRIVFSGAGSFLTFTTTSRIPALQITGNKTINGTIYCVDFGAGAGVALTGTLNQGISGGTIDVSGTLGPQAPGLLGASVLTAGHSGNVLIKLTGNGSIGYQSRLVSPGGVEIDTSGTYSTSGYPGLILISSSNEIPRFKITNGGISNFQLRLNAGNSNADGDKFSLDLGNKTVTVLELFNNSRPSTAVNTEINIVGTASFLLVSNTSSTNTFSPSSDTPSFIFRGGSLSASNISSAYSYTYLQGGNQILRSNPLLFDSDFTHTVGSFQIIGPPSNIGYTLTRKMTISSITASTPVNINLISKTASQIINCDFTDVNAVGEEIVAINGTLLRTTNVTNVYPTGGGGTGSAGGNFVFFS